MADERVETTELELSFKLTTSEAKSAVLWASKIASDSSSSSNVMFFVLDGNQLSIQAASGVVAGKYNLMVSNLHFTGEHEGPVPIQLSSVFISSLMSSIRDRDFTFIYNETVKKIYSGKGGAPRKESSKSVVVKTQRQKFTVPVVNEVSSLHMLDQPRSMGKINWTKLNSALKYMNTMTSKDEALSDLSGINIKVSPSSKELSIAATDRYRLGRIIIPFDSVENDRRQEEDFVINVDGARVLSLINQMSEAENVSIYLDAPNATEATGATNASKNVIGFSTADCLAMSVLKDVNFPNFDRLISQPSPNAVVLDRKELLDAFNVASTLTSGTVKIAQLTFTTDGEAVIVSDNSEESLSYTAGENTGETVAEDISFKINCQYLTAILNGLKTKNVVYSFSTPLKPVVLKEIDDEGEVNPNIYTMFSPIRG